MNNENQSPPVGSGGDLREAVEATRRQINVLKDRIRYWENEGSPLDHEAMRDWMDSFLRLLPPPPSVQAPTGFLEMAQDLEDAHGVIFRLTSALESVADVEGDASEEVKSAWLEATRWMAGEPPMGAPGVNPQGAGAAVHEYWCQSIFGNGKACNCGADPSAPPALREPSALCVQRVSDEALARHLATIDSIGLDHLIALDLRDLRAAPPTAAMEIPSPKGSPEPSQAEGVQP